MLFFCLVEQNRVALNDSECSRSDHGAGRIERPNTVLFCEIHPAEVSEVLFSHISRLTEGSILTGLTDLFLSPSLQGII